MKTHWITPIWFCMLFIILTGCSPNPRDPGPSGINARYPAGLALSSPFDWIDGSSAGETIFVNGKQSRYKWTTDYIDNAADGSFPVRFAFIPFAIIHRVFPATCFGPEVAYVNHPDDDGINSGQFPLGEVGAWLETEAASGNACSAEKLNSELRSINEPWRASLMMAGSMAYFVESADTLTTPRKGESVTFTSDLNAFFDQFGSVSFVFTDATIMHQSNGDWSYRVSVDFTRDWEGSGPYTHKINVQLDHHPITADTDNEYSGILKYQVSGGSGDVHFAGDTCPNTSDRTYNGSVKYLRTSATRISVQARSATFCGTQVDGYINSGTEDNGMVDDDFAYDGSNSGWSENFRLYAAELNPDTLAGKYSYIWQEAPGDGYSRIFNVGVTETNRILIGESYFGFGDPIATTDGTIQNYICNVSGPNAGLSLVDRRHVDRLQRQSFTLDINTGIFVPSGSDPSNISYAPTNSCDYDGSAPNGNFLFDTDADGLTSDETHQVVTNDLWKVDGGFLPDMVVNTGVTISSPPGGWPSSQ